MQCLEQGGCHQFPTHPGSTGTSRTGCTFSYLVTQAFLPIVSFLGGGVLSLALPDSERSTFQNLVPLASFEKPSLIAIPSPSSSRHSQLKSGSQAVCLCPPTPTPARAPFLQAARAKSTPGPALPLSFRPLPSSSVVSLALHLLVSALLSVPLSPHSPASGLSFLIREKGRFGAGRGSILLAPSQDC